MDSVMAVLDMSGILMANSSQAMVAHRPRTPSRCGCAKKKGPVSNDVEMFKFSYLMYLSFCLCNLVMETYTKKWLGMAHV